MDRKNYLKSRLMEAMKATHPKTEKDKKLAALAEPKNKITHKDVLVGRGVLKKEEVEQIDELSKWKKHAVMVNKNDRQRVVVKRSNAKNYPEHEGWKEVAPGQKIKEEKLTHLATFVPKEGSRARDHISIPVHPDRGEKSHNADFRKIFGKDIASQYKLHGVLQLHEEVDQVDESSYSAKSARAGKDIGKPGKMFAKIAASAAEKYGSEERGKKVAGAVLKKLRAKK